MSDQLVLDASAADAEYTIDRINIRVKLTLSGNYGKYAVGESIKVIIDDPQKIEHDMIVYSNHCDANNPETTSVIEGYYTRISGIDTSGLIEIDA